MAGWQDQATGFYHTVFANDRWWLITPAGNPAFHTALSNAVLTWQYTPVTGRESMFAELPTSESFTGAWKNNVWGEQGQVSYVSFQIANMVRKYGDGWQDAASALLLQRLGAFGMQGGGKWTPRIPNVPVTPVLSHSDVPNVARHPDIFDPAIVARLRGSLARQIGADATNPFIIGWSVGNEYDEIVTTDETQAMLALGASAPVKRALVDQALAALYGGDLGNLAAGWQISAATAADAYAAVPHAPAADVEALRQFFAGAYYQAIYQAVKSIDPDHLYLGFWIVPDWWVNASDFRMIAANCDVIGIDYYQPKFLSAELDGLIREAGKPVLIGEFSFPAAYRGGRGFGSAGYSQNVTGSDAESGDLYAQWLADTSAYPYCIGVSWFECHDEPVSGRGPGSGPNLVYGEDYAFGLVDVADRPKYDLVERVRAANLAALASLKLQ